MEEEEKTWDFGLVVVKPDGERVVFDAPQMGSLEGEVLWKKIKKAFDL